MRGHKLVLNCVLRGQGVPPSQACSVQLDENEIWSDPPLPNTSKFHVCMNVPHGTWLKEYFSIDMHRKVYKMYTYITYIYNICVCMYRFMCDHWVSTCIWQIYFYILYIHIYTNISTSLCSLFAYSYLSSIHILFPMWFIVYSFVYTLLFLC